MVWYFMEWLIPSQVLRLFKLRVKLPAMIRLRDEDLVQTFHRSSGPGGQHVNKVSTAVTLLHKPSGLRVTASDSRSQSMNRKLAMERLLAEWERRQAEKRQTRLAEISKVRRQKAKRSRRTKRKLVEGKRLRGETKKLRGKVPDS
jgi:protein subunit release factor B